MTALVRVLRSARRWSIVPGRPSKTMRSHSAQGSGAVCPGFTTRLRPSAAGPAKRCQSGSSATGRHRFGGFGRSAENSVSLGGDDSESMSVDSVSSEQVRTSLTVACLPPQCPQAIIALVQASVVRYAGIRSLPLLPGYQLVTPLADSGSP